MKKKKEIPIKITIDIVKNKISWDYNCDISTFLFYIGRIEHLTQLELDKLDNER